MRCEALSSCVKKLVKRTVSERESEILQNILHSISLFLLLNITKSKKSFGASKVNLQETKLISSVISFSFKLLRSDIWDLNRGFNLMESQ